MYLRLYIVLWLSVIIIITDFRGALSQSSVTARLKSHYNTKVCGTSKEKEVLITLGMGQILFTDSLFAFDVLVKYDPAKIKIEGPVYLNTISEFTKYREVNIGYESNIVRAFAFSDVPFAGNRELIGFYGRLLTECSDPVELEIVSLELTDDYKKTLNIESKVFITPYRDVKESNKVEISMSSDNLMFDMGKRENYLDVAANINPYMELSEMFFDIYLDNSNIFNLEDVTSTDENISIEYLNKINDNEYELKINVFGDFKNNNILKFKIVDLNKSKNDFNSYIVVTPRDFGNCNCYSKFEGKTGKLVSKGDTIATNVNDQITNDYSINYRITDGIIEIVNPFAGYVRYLELYDMIGNKICKVDIDNNDRNIVSRIKSVTNGIYIIRLVTDKKEINKSIIIYN